MKTGDWFDSQKSKPPYWLRSDARDLIEHERKYREHLKVHRPRGRK